MEETRRRPDAETETDLTHVGRRTGNEADDTLGGEETSPATPLLLTGDFTVLTFHALTHSFVSSRNISICR